MSVPSLNPGLVWLLRRSPLTLWRSCRKRLTGVKGALLAIFLFVFLLVILGGAVLQVFLEPEDVAETAARARTFGPLVMLAMTALTTLAPAQRRGGLYFKPAEVGLLFPAPLSRRELLAYHVLSRAQVQVLSALWISMFIVRHAPTWYGCIAGCLVGLLFLQLFGQVLALMTAAAGMRVARPVRWCVAIAVFGAIVAGGASAAAQIEIDNGALAAMHALAAHPVVQVVTLPFVPMVNTFAATSLPGVAVWGAASIGLLTCLVAVIARLDVAYEEAALAVSRDVRRKLQRMRAGGGALAAMGPSQAKFSVPRLPAFGGAGPIAWRQCVEIVRNVRAVLTSMLVLLIWPAIAGGAVVFADSGGVDRMELIGIAGIPMVLLFSVMWTQYISFDFGYLRSLPLPSVAIAAGQIGPTALLLAGMQFLLVAIIVVMTDIVPLFVLAALFPALVQFAWAVIALDNVLFLLIPHRLDPDDATNVGFVGRMMLSMSLKFLGLFVIAVVAGGVGAGLGYVCGQSLLVGLLVAAVLVVAANVLLTLLVARAFDAFDPSRDVPA